jgi:tRNA(fMet)-specific endonuclease VapC
VIERAGLVPVMELPRAGAIRAGLEINGEISATTIWMAAHAKAAGLVLITNDERQFRGVQRLKTQN